jgi:Fe2+ transport system protein FeoA
MQLTLDKARPGSSYTIKALLGEFAGWVRMMELGFKRGETITVLQPATVSGLLKVRIKRTRFALSASRAESIVIEPVSVPVVVAAP